MELNITVRIARHPAPGGRRFSEFPVVLEPRMSVLDALFRIQRQQDESIAFRCACRVGMCGTCAVMVNGVPRLACSTRVATLETDLLTIEPLPRYPVIKDLAVSLEPFFVQWKRARPAFRPRDPGAATPARIVPDSPFGRLAAPKRDCITCGACYSACSFTATNGHYLGPAAINRAFLRLLDPRDAASAERLRILDEESTGVWRCHTQFNCAAVCPRGINLTDSIGRIKRALLRPAQAFTS